MYPVLKADRQQHGFLLLRIYIVLLYCLSLNVGETDVPCLPAVGHAPFLAHNGFAQRPGWSLFVNDF